MSADGKNAVRYAVAEQLVTCLEPIRGSPRPPVSLTLVGHSAGSVVAFDFLYFLFSDRTLEEFIDPAKVTKAERFDATMNALVELKQMAIAGQLRVRRLFTFGSPITPLAYRSDKVLQILAGPDGANRLDPADYGLLANLATFGDALANPRWINLWDKDDVIAWPVEPLMQGAGDVVVDRYIDVSDTPTEAHTAYWTSEEIHNAIAAAW